MALDPEIAGQLTQLTIVGAQNSQQLNSLLDRTLQGNQGTILQLSTQLTAAASLNMQTTLDPMEAAAAANLRSSQDPSHFAGLQTAAGVPKQGQT